MQLNLLVIIYIVDGLYYSDDCDVTADFGLDEKIHVTGLSIA